MMLLFQFDTAGQCTETGDSQEQASDCDTCEGDKVLEQDVVASQRTSCRL